MTENANRSFQNSWDRADATVSDVGLDIDGHQVMQYWERPLMRLLARLVTRNPSGSVLEVGFGLGLSAGEIMSFGCGSYTVIEAHPVIADEARNWARRQAVPVKVVEGYWQQQLPSLGAYDAILFDTYPTNPTEMSQEQWEFVLPFLDAAIGHLQPRGVISYYSDETRNFRNDHLEMLLSKFNTVELHVLEPLAPPPSCDYWKADHMVVPCVSAPRLAGKTDWS